MSAKAEESVSGKMEAVYARFDAAEFLRAMRTISALCDEVRAELDSDGLRVDAVDPAHVAYIRLTLPAEEGPTSSAVFGLNVDSIRDFVRSVLRSSLANPWLDLRLGEETAPRVTITVGRMSKTFEFVDPVGIAKPEHLVLPGEKAAVRVSAVGLRDALKILSTRDDYVKMSLSGSIGDEGLVVLDDEARYRVPITDMEEVKEIAGMMHPDARSSFPTSYLQTVLEAHADAGGNVTLALGLDYPIRMLWSAGGGDVEVLIAPRISNEE